MTEEYHNPMAAAAAEAHRPQEAGEQEPPYPDIDEVQQHEDASPSVPVSIDGPVQTQQLPSIGWRTHHYSINNVGDTNVPGPIEIAPYNPRRKSLTISVAGQIAYISDNKQECNSNSGFRLASPSAITLTHIQPVYLIGGNVAASEIGVLEEFWTR